MVLPSLHKYGLDKNGLDKHDLDKNGLDIVLTNWSCQTWSYQTWSCQTWSCQTWSCQTWSCQTWSSHKLSIMVLTLLVNHGLDMVFILFSNNLLAVLDWLSILLTLEIVRFRYFLMKFLWHRRKYLTDLFAKINCLLINVHKTPPLRSR